MQLVWKSLNNWPEAHIILTMQVQTMSLTEYMEQRRKEIDRYVQGEHKWYGDVDTSTMMQSVSYNNEVIPWYMK
jgi:hypothetical protein